MTSLFYRQFRNLCSVLKIKTRHKDRLLVDVTDIDQTRTIWNNCKNSLQFDLSDIKIKVIDFTLPKTKDAKFTKSIDELYNSAKQNLLVQIIDFYFRRYLPNLLKNSTLLISYINKVIIITDGYLEAEKGPAWHKIYSYQKNNCTNQLPLK